MTWTERNVAAPVTLFAVRRVAVGPRLFLCSCACYASGQPVISDSCLRNLSLRSCLRFCTR